MFRAVIFIAGAGCSFSLRAARAHTRAHTPRPYPRTYSAHILLCTPGYVHPTVGMCRVCAQCMCAQTRLCAQVCAQKPLLCKASSLMCSRQSVCAQYVRGYVRKSPRGTIRSKMGGPQTAGERQIQYRHAYPAHILCAHTCAHTTRTYPRTCRTHIPGAHTCAHTRAHAFRT